MFSDSNGTLSIIVYAFGPFYEIDLDVYVTSSKCIGLVNPVWMCPYAGRLLNVANDTTEQSNFVQHTFREFSLKCFLNSNYGPKVIELTFTELSVCLVVQSIPSDHFKQLLSSFYVTMNLQFEMYGIHMHIVSPDWRNHGDYDHVVLTVMNQTYQHRAYIRSGAPYTKNLHFQNASTVFIGENRPNISHQHLYRLTLTPSHHEHSCSHSYPTIIESRLGPLSLTDVQDTCGYLDFRKATSHSVRLRSHLIGQNARQKMVKSYWHFVRNDSCTLLFIRDSFSIQYRTVPMFYFEAVELDNFFIGYDEVTMITYAKAADCSTCFAHYRVVAVDVLTQSTVVDSEVVFQVAWLLNITNLMLLLFIVILVYEGTMLIRHTLYITCTYNTWFILFSMRDTLMNIALE